MSTLTEMGSSKSAGMASSPPPVLSAAMAGTGDGGLYGKTGILVGTTGIIVFQFILGPIAIVLGSVALRKGEKTLGAIAVILGGVDIIVYAILALTFVATLI